MAVPRFEGAVVFLVGTAFLPARTFFGTFATAALDVVPLEALVVSTFFAATFLAAAAFAAVTVFVTAFLPAEVDLTADAFVEALFAGRAFVTGFGAATTLAGLF